MSECKNCGREDGHWIGCAKALSALMANDWKDECAFDGCSEPRKSDDKRVKFCEFHSDPKNRK